MLNLSLLTNGGQKAEEKSLQSVTYSVDGRTEVPIPLIMLPFLSSFFPSALRSQGEVSPSARLHGLGQDHVGENCPIPVNYSPFRQKLILRQGKAEQS